jgi:hypothetical protein
MTIAWKPNITAFIDPDAQLEYTLNFSDCAPTAGAEIASYLIVPSEGVTVVEHAREGSRITAWVKNVAEGAQERITFRVTWNTTPAVTDDRSIRLIGAQK